MSASMSLAGEGALWIQPDGPNTEPKFLGCHEMGDIDEPVGDVKLLYCPDPAVPNRWLVVGSVQGTGGPVSTSLMTDILATADYLERVTCPVPLYVHHVSCGRKDVFGSYDRSYALVNTRITSRKLSKLTARQPDNQDRAQQAFELKAESLLRLFELKATRLTVSDAEDVFAITHCDSAACAGDCGDSVNAGDTLFAAGGVLVGSAGNKADVISSPDAGVNWSAMATKPFAGSEVISAVACFQLDRNTTRVLVARGTTDGAAPAEIAYSDDGGATWTNVNVGSVNGQYAIGSKSLFAKNIYEIWLATTDGYVYFSSDGGVSWTAQTSGTLTTEDLTSVRFVGDYGYAAGVNNAVIKTSDGGSTWEVVTGPTGQGADTINTLAVLDRNHVWLGYSDATIYYTNNGGTTWYKRSGWSGENVGEVMDMDWFSNYVGAMVVNNASPVGSILYTINGGYTWESVSTPTNSGLNAIHVIDESTFYAVGNTNGGTGVIIRVNGG